MVQMLWDRGESNGYAQRRHRQPAAGHAAARAAHEHRRRRPPGHQLLGREHGADASGAGIHKPIVYDGRWPGVNVGWNLPAMTLPMEGLGARLLGPRARSATIRGRPTRRTCSEPTSRRSRTSRTAPGWTRTRTRAGLPPNSRWCPTSCMPDGASEHHRHLQRGPLLRLSVRRPVGRFASGFEGGRPRCNRARSFSFCRGLLLPFPASGCPDGAREVQVSRCLRYRPSVFGADESPNNERSQGAAR